MVKPITLRELADILPLVADVEVGSGMDLENEEQRNWLLDKLSRYAAAGAEFFGCFEKDSLIGFVTILMETRPAGVFEGWGTCELLQIGVMPQHRKGGHATEMVDYVVQLLEERRCACLYLHTYARDAVSIAFYIKNGFVPAGTVPHVYGPGLEGMLYLARKL